MRIDIRFALATAFSIAYIAIITFPTGCFPYSDLPATHVHK
jgi:hypothetical protein